MNSGSVRQGASRGGGAEHGMVRLLQVALKCIDSSVRPTMSQVAQMIRSLKDEEDRSSVSDTDPK